MGPVGAVIVNYNAAAHLVPCIESLLSEGVSRILVVDNASADDSARVLERSGLGAEWVPAGSNLGYGAGANVGIRQLDTPWVLVCNPDTVVHPGTIKALVAALEQDGRRGIAGPRIENTDGSLYPSARTFPALGDAIGHAFLGMVLPANRWSRRYKMLGWDHASQAEVDWVSGAFFLARGETLADLGGFDEAYFMYSEDVDLCWRAWRRGWTVVYEPAASISHVQGASTDLRPYRMIAEHHRALLRFAWRSNQGWRRLLIPPVAAGLAARMLLAWVQRVREGYLTRH